MNNKPPTKKAKRLKEALDMVEANFPDKMLLQELKDAFKDEMIETIDLAENMGKMEVCDEIREIVEDELKSMILSKSMVTSGAVDMSKHLMDSYKSLAERMTKKLKEIADNAKRSYDKAIS